MYNMMKTFDIIILIIVCNFKIMNTMKNIKIVKTIPGRQQDNLLQ